MFYRNFLSWKRKKSLKKVRPRRGNFYLEGSSNEINYVKIFQNHGGDGHGNVAKPKI